MKWWQSRTVWTGVAVIALAVLQAFVDGLGWRETLGVLLGALVAYFRVNATGPVDKVNGPKLPGPPGVLAFGLVALVATGCVTSFKSCVLLVDRDGPGGIWRCDGQDFPVAHVSPWLQKCAKEKEEGLR